MGASYSTSLFMALKPYLIACWMMSPSREIKIIAIPAPLMLLELSIERVHFEAGHSVMQIISLLACARTFGVKLVMRPGGEVCNCYNVAGLALKVLR